MSLFSDTQELLLQRVLWNIKNNNYDNKYLTEVLYNTLLITKLMPMCKSYLYGPEIQVFQAVYNTKIIVEDEDTITTAIKYNATLVLNLGNAFGAGGGVEFGQRAQEEHLCRCSSLLFSLYDAFKSAKEKSHNDNDNCKGDKRYIPEKSVLYTDKVVFVKDKSYNMYDNPYSCSVITACAVRYNRIQSYSERDENVMFQTIRGILHTAYINGHSTIVLGALGCGAFCNNPYECALIFKKCIESYNGAFDKIIFAVLSGSSNNNYNIFKDVFSK